MRPLRPPSPSTWPPSSRNSSASALREALPATPTQFPTGSGTPRLALDGLGRIRLEPDLSYWTRGECTFIGDVKYKRDTRAGHNDDLYQLLAYATAARLPSAMLVYANGPPGPVTHHVPATGAHLHIRHLDLSRPPVDQLAQIQRLAAEIQRASPHVAAATP